MIVKNCPDCGTDFIATNRNTVRCDTCQRKYRNKDRHGDKRHNTPHFIGVDGEGIGDKYVLLGVGDEQIEWPDGCQDVLSIFRFLYDQYLANPDAYFVGFYLNYDWNMWLKLMPLNRLDFIYGPQIAKRMRQKSPIPFPVRYQGWEWDFLPGKRFKLRPQEDGARFMYICDTGPFFQTSLLTALYKLAPGSELPKSMMRKLEQGKSKRASAKLDNKMREYNRLENQALSHLLIEIDHSLNSLGLPLGRTEFHGPGQAGQKWILKQKNAKEINHKIMEMPRSQYDAIVASYYGGIFEITTHGHVPGTSYEYDINSAYPYQISRLPCLCGDWEWVDPPQYPMKNDGSLTLLHVSFEGTGMLGPLPFRMADRSIRRPLSGSGWYWQSELQAAWRAGMISYHSVDKALRYVPCGHEPPFAGIEYLYDVRLRVGKDSSIGKGCKIIYNCVYGKFAQSVGNPRASNAVYASLITSGCRCMILDAIATHPRGSEAVMMIATDAVFFDTPHPNLPLSNRLGDWDLKSRENLTIFKPGMYWDDDARKALESGKAPIFKSRGINSKDFASSIGEVDRIFRDEFPARWPAVDLAIRFSQISVRQAYRRTQAVQPPELREEMFRAIAGKVMTDLVVHQSSDPVSKRDTVFMPVINGARRSMPYQGSIWMETVPYDARFGRPEDELEYTDTEDGPIDNAIAAALQLRSE